MDLREGPGGKEAAAVEEKEVATLGVLQEKG